MKTFQKEPKSNIFAHILIKMFCKERLYEKDIQDEFDLKDRTLREYFSKLNEIFNELNHLKKCQYQITKGKDENHKQYWYITNNALSPQSDTNEEGEIVLKNLAIDNLDKIISFHLAKTVLNRVLPDNLKTELSETFNNLVNSIKYKKDCAGILNNFDKIFYFFWYAPKKTDISQNLQVIIDGIIKKRVLKCKYFGLNYEQSYTSEQKQGADNNVDTNKPGSNNHPYTFELKPLSIIFNQGVLYLLAKSTGRKKQEIRTFAIDRFKSIKLTGISFKFNYDKFDPSKYLNKNIGIITTKKKKSFELIFSKDKILQRTLQEREWFEEQRFEELSDGSLKMKFVAYPTIEVQRWIRSYGKDVKLIEPKDFLKKKF